MAAILVGILVGLFFALFVVKFQSDEFIIGTALNIFAGGLTVFLLRTLFQVEGYLPGDPRTGQWWGFPRWTWDF